jgi:hypothetical protein
VKQLTGEARLGATLRASLSPFGGQAGVTSKLSLTTYDAPRAMAWRTSVLGCVQVEHRFELQAREPTGTRCVERPSRWKDAAAAAAPAPGLTRARSRRRLVHTGRVEGPLSGVLEQSSGAGFAQMMHALARRAEQLLPTAAQHAHARSHMASCAV